MDDSQVQQSSQDDPNKWPETEVHQLLRLEAVLFLAREPLRSRKLSELASLQDGTQARSLVKRLNEKYDRQARAFQVKQVAGGYRLMTRPQFGSWLRKIQVDWEPHPMRSPPLRLSVPAQETLAVVAYRQPVLRAEIEAIRGVSCGEILKQLMEKRLVKIAGRAAELGNPYVYATTRFFLEAFGLANLESLPRASKLRGQGIPDWSSAQHPATSQNNNQSVDDIPSPE